MVLGVGRQLAEYFFNIAEDKPFRLRQQIAKLVDDINQMAMLFINFRQTGYKVIIPDKRVHDFSSRKNAAAIDLLRAPQKIQSSDGTTSHSTKRDETCAKSLVISKTRREQKIATQYCDEIWIF
jgi:hypothetical protein